MTLDEIRKRIRDQALVEEQELSDTLLDIWVNAAKTRVETAQDWPFLRTETDLTFTSGTSEKAVPDDFAHEDEVRKISTSNPDHAIPLIPLSYEERPTNISTTGNVEFYWVDYDSDGVRKLFIWREPNEEHTIRLRYYKNADSLSNDGDTPEWDAQFHDILVLGGLFRVYEWLDMWQEARVIKEDFDEAVARMDFFYHRIRRSMRYGGRRRFRRANSPDTAPFSFEIQ